MSDPPRWLEEGGDAPEEARELLRHAQPTRRVDRATLIATAATLAELGARPAVAVALAKLAALPQAVAALPIAAKVITSMALVSAVAIVTVPAESGPHAPRRPRSSLVHAAPASAPVRATVPRIAPQLNREPVQTPAMPVLPEPAQLDTDAALAIAQPSAPALARRSVARARLRNVASDEPTATSKLPPAPAPIDALAAEVATLDAARAALGDAPARALRLADEHASRFPSAMLAAERELIAIDALVRLGRRDEARTRAARLRTRQPNGLYESRLSALLE